MKRFICVLLLLALCLGQAAVADQVVFATANVNLREGPGKDARKIGSAQDGVGLEYLGETRADADGVDWYKVLYEDRAVWISSKYSVLEDIEVDVPDAGKDETAQPTEVLVIGDADVTELSGWYLADLAAAAKALGLEDYTRDENSEVPNMYHNDALLIAGESLAEHFRLTGAGYALFGVTVGMDIESARALMKEAGLVEYASGIGVYFQHPAGDKSLVDADGFDSGIDITTDADQRVTEISWSSYTG